MSISTTNNDDNDDNYDDMAQTPIVRCDDAAATFSCCSANGRNGKQLHDGYAECKDPDTNRRIELGKGTFAVVYQAQYRNQQQESATGTFSQRNVAIKTTKPTTWDVNDGRPIITYDDVEEQCQEVRTLIKMRRRASIGSDDGSENNHVVQIYEYFWDCATNELHLVLELLPAGNLREWMTTMQQNDTVVTDKQAKQAATSILHGIAAIHRQGIVHRDIKESNVLFGAVNDLTTLKICDFGCAKDLSCNHNHNTDMESIDDESTLPPTRTRTMLQQTKGLCGTYGYLAPEIYRGESYGCQVDLFSFGVLLFRLLSGLAPWAAKDSVETETATINLHYSVDGDSWKTHVSRLAVALIKDRLLTQANERATAKEALQHEWFDETSDKTMPIHATTPLPLVTTTTSAAAVTVLDSLATGIMLLPVADMGTLETDQCSDSSDDKSDILDVVAELLESPYPFKTDWNARANESSKTTIAHGELILGAVHDTSSSCLAAEKASRSIAGALTVPMGSDNDQTNAKRMITLPSAAPKPTKRRRMKCMALDIPDCVWASLVGLATLGGSVLILLLVSWLTKSECKD